MTATNVNPYADQTHRVGCGCLAPACVRLRELTEQLDAMEAAAGPWCRLRVAESRRSPEDLRARQFPAGWAVNDQISPRLRERSLHCTVIASLVHLVDHGESYESAVVEALMMLSKDRQRLTDALVEKFARAPRPPRDKWGEPLNPYDLSTRREGGQR